MKLCPTCKKNYPDDANFCPEESCATPDGPQRLVAAANGAAAAGPGGRFQPLAKLGGGTTGEVWRARDSQTGAEVAYKVVAADVLPNPGAVARADRELKQLMRVASPRLATIVDCGTTPDGRLYVATELLEGAESLDKHLRRGPVPLDRAKAVVAQIGHALLEAQKAGLVHRDLAPKNVLVLPSGDVKVINFPVAKPVTDRVAGVPAYLSPEQAQGKTADQRSNTYSLACILYHLLTGEPPFAASDPQALLELHVSSPPLAPSQRRPAANLPTDVDKVILKALDKSSSRRQLTLRLFLSEVESVSAAPAAGAPGAPARDAGFAKTMLFAGGQAEVQKMVANAIASRNAGGKPAPAPAAAPAPSHVSFANPAPAPAPAAQAGYAPTPLPDPPLPPSAAGAPAPAAIAQTVAAAAASSVSPSSPASRLTPPPVTPAPAGGEPVRVASAPLETHAVSNTPPKEPAGHAPAPSAEAGGKGPVKSGAAFRETLWFKKGDVDQMVAEAKAKMAAAGANPAAAPTPEVAGDDVRPIEDRYVDDGSVTAEDRKKFSLRTGGTATSLPVVGKEIPGEKMSEADLVEELGGGKKKMVLVAAAAVVVAAIVAVVMMMSGGKSETPKPAAAAPAPAAPVAAVPPPAPAPAAPAPAAAAPAAPEPAAAAAVAKDEKPAEAAPSRKRAARTAAKKPVDKKRARR